MSDVIGRGVIELVADSSGVNAAIASARRSIGGLGDATRTSSARASASIDRYVKSLQTQNATMGMSTREATAYQLALRGATNEQLRAADAALRYADIQRRNASIRSGINTGAALIATAAVAGVIAAAVAFDRLVKSAGDFQDMAEKSGDTAENIASLAVAAATAGTEMNTVVAASAKLTKSLVGVDDESKDVGAAIAALGLNLADIKKLAPADQFQKIGQALNGFQDGAGKSAVAMALFGKAGADLLPFLKEIGQEGSRQVILSQKQIQLADEYADKQAKLRAELSLTIQAIAVEAVPVYNDFIKAIKDTITQISGLGDQAKGLNSSAIQDFAENGAKALAFLIDAADGVSRSFQGAGLTIGAAIAIASSNLRGDVKGSINIAKQLMVDLEQIRQRAFLGDNLQKNIDARKQAEADAAANGGREGRGSKAPALKFEGSTKDKKDQAASESKARLNADLSEIKAAGDAQVSTYANAEKIIDGLRSASLIDESTYYQEKRRLLDANTSAQEGAFSNEIARLSSENLAGKDKIDNDNKIAAATAKLAKVRDDAATSRVLLGIQETAANDKVAQSYKNASDAAQDYIDTIKRQNAREIEGIGRGQKFRENQSGLNGIEDKFTGQRQGLDRDLRNGKINQKEFDTYLTIARDTYEQEVQLYRDRTDSIEAAQDDWVNGANEAMNNYIDQSRDIAGQTQQAFTNAFQGMEDALVSFVMTGKLDFKSLANSIVADITRIIIKQQIMNALGMTGGGGGNMIGSMFSAAMSFFGGAPTGGGITNSTTGSLGSLGLSGGRAIGGPVSAGGMYRVNESGPELLNVAGKQYLMMGNQSGKVDANPAGGGQQVVQNVNFYNNGPVDRHAQQQVAAAAYRGAQRAAVRNT